MSIYLQNNVHLPTTIPPVVKTGNFSNVTDRKVCLFVESELTKLFVPSIEFFVGCKSTNLLKIMIYLANKCEPIKLFTAIKRLPELLTIYSDIARI